MKVLVINSGSSSIKFQLFVVERHKPLAQGLIEQIGAEVSHVKFKYLDSKGREHLIEMEREIKNHEDGIILAEELLSESNIVKSLNALGGIGHRVVHGGEEFKDPVIIDNNVIATIKRLSTLAPLHNPANVTGIEVCMQHAPDVPQVAVFDTAFHQSMPQYAYMYPLPYEYYEKYDVRRYGFHGTSHRYVAKEFSKLIGKPKSKCNIITLHLGNGASVTALKNGKSVDTSMGMTPLEGLMMGTRSGDIDPAIINYLCEQTEKNPKEIDNILNKKSGLKGICGNNDLREIIDHASSGDERAELALDMFCYRIKKYIGSYTVVLGKVDGIVFTGGIGENSALVRKKVCEDLEDSIGVTLDKKRNGAPSKEEREISSDHSKIKVFVIPTNEELEIAFQTRELIKNLNKGENV